MKSQTDCPIKINDMYFENEIIAHKNKNKLMPRLTCLQLSSLALCLMSKTKYFCIIRDHSWKDKRKKQHFCAMTITRWSSRKTCKPALLQTEISGSEVSSLVYEEIGVFMHLDEIYLRSDRFGACLHYFR